jgi:hypothetical protein
MSMRSRQLVLFTLIFLFSIVVGCYDSSLSGGCNFLRALQPTVGAAPRVCPNKKGSLREKFIKNLIQNHSKLINEKLMDN